MPTEPKPTQRADGRWVLAVQVGRGSREFRSRRYLYGSSPEAVLAARAKLLRELEAGTRPADLRLTVGTYLVRWLATLQVRPRTLESYEHAVRAHIAPRLGAISLSALTALDVDEMVGGLLRAGTGRRSVEYSLTVLRIALNRAVKQGRLPSNVALGATRPRVVRREARPLSIDEARQLLAVVAGDRLEALWVTALALGLRRGEITGLMWSDIDLQASTVTVARTLHYVPGQPFELREPKTKRSRRTLRMPPVVAAALQEHRRRQLEERMLTGGAWKVQELVFTTSTGGPLSGSTLVHALHRHCAKAGLPAIRVHDLRHTTASLMVAAGIPLRDVQEVLGHTTLAITSDTYVHVAPSQAEPAAAMQRMIGSRLEAAR
jgi:integrase